MALTLSLGEVAEAAPSTVPLTVQSVCAIEVAKHVSRDGSLGPLKDAPKSLFYTMRIPGEGQMQVDVRLTGHPSVTLYSNDEFLTFQSDDFAGFFQVIDMGDDESSEVVFVVQGEGLSPEGKKHALTAVYYGACEDLAS